MESFQALRRRTTDLLNSLPQSLPHPQSPNKPPNPSIKGTWEKVDVPPLPRSSHTVSVVGGSAYLFGGELKPREPVGNDMHVINLPLSLSASADSYPVKAEHARRPGQDAAPHPTAAAAATTTTPELEKGMQEVSLESQDSLAPEGAEAEATATPEIEKKAPEPKGKEVAGPEPADLGEVPAPRVGHAAAVIGSRIFMFGGRGGPEMTPLQENGRVWVFDTRTHTWTYLDPSPSAAGKAVRFPAPRSYHCATAVDRPRDFAHRRDDKPETWSDWAMGDSAKVGIPQAPIVGNVAAAAVDEEDLGYGTFFVHAGCLASGERASDVWAFNVRSRAWSELPSAPGPARGGASLCVTKGKLWRFGGFDGETEVGGRVDFLHLAADFFDDAVSQGEVAVTARKGWESVTQPAQPPPSIAPEEARPLDAADEWPTPRSVSSLLPLTVHGREYLVLLMGEVSPSPEGHNAAGGLLSDVWVFHVPTAAGPARSVASVKDAVWGAIGSKKAAVPEGKWARVATEPFDDDESDEMPAPRGWASADVVSELEEPGVLVWGGVGAGNERLGDGWILRLS